MMSKTIANKVTEVIRMLIQQTIVVEVRKAGMFSIQMDTTQDLTSKDQCIVVLRYVTDLVHERLIEVIDCESSTGQYFVDLVKQTLEKMDIDIKRVVLVMQKTAQLICRDNTGASLHCSQESLLTKYTGGVSHMFSTLC